MNIRNKVEKKPRLLKKLDLNPLSNGGLNRHNLLQPFYNSLITLQ